MTFKTMMRDIQRIQKRAAVFMSEFVSFYSELSTLFLFNTISKLNVLLPTSTCTAAAMNE
jgi:hypothetical protein